jgi:glycosyltransferase involved in cell wall biosynthesis
MSSYATGVSVIIACYNSSKVIEQTLVHLQNQKNAENINWEVILIDNNCTDTTAEIAQRTWKINAKVKLEIITESKIGEANARKAGIKAAKYNILSIVDDDNRVSENWIATISDYFKNPEIGLVGCAGEGDFESSPPEWFERHQHAFAIGSLYKGDFTDITPDAIVPGAGLCVRKEIFDKLYSIDWQPFLTGRVGNMQSAGADSEICYITRHLGYKNYYSNELKFKHFTTDSRISWQRLENMFSGFGASDVFTLPYKILYAEATGKNSFVDTFRKKWWFNFITKKLATWLRYGFLSKNSEIKNLMNIRNKAFCDVIWENRIAFENSFEYLKNIKSKINALKCTPIN